MRTRKWNNQSDIVRSKQAKISVSNQARVGLGPTALEAANNFGTPLQKGVRGPFPGIV